RLYDFHDAPSTRALINSLQSMRVTPCAAAVQFGLQTCMARGLDIELEVDETGFSGSNLFLFGQVLQHFFALYCSINSFTRLTLKIQGKEGIFHQWTPVIGARALL
ncbi:MAG TPA: type VI secretion system baseplate subunit TssF, partial [Pseudomonadales bacterium]|nr:type VI secretion system baseplate subunit TssF [Pseudomonadales bacterium]